LNLEEILGLKIDQRVGGVLRFDFEQQRAWQQQQDKRTQSEEEWIIWANANAETVRRIEQRRGWWQRPNWAGVTNLKPQDLPVDPPPGLISYPAWKHKNYYLRMTGVQYHPTAKRYVYRPAEQRDVQLKARRVGRPTNPNKLNNAEKQKQYREKLKLKKQMSEI